MTSLDTPHIAPKQAFTFYADPDSPLRAHVSVPPDNEKRKEVYLGIDLDHTSRSTLLENSDVDPVALRDRWQRVRNLRLSVDTPANKPPRLILRDGENLVAQHVYDDTSAAKQARAHTRILDRTASYLRKTADNPANGFPYFTPFLHYMSLVDEPAYLAFGLRFFDGRTMYRKLQHAAFDTHMSAINHWGDIIDKFTPRLVETTAGRFGLAVHDTNRATVQTIPYDITTPQSRETGQAALMDALQEIYYLHNAPRTRLKM